MKFREKYEIEIINENFTLGSLDYCKKKIVNFLNGKYITEYKNLIRYISFLKHGLKVFNSSIKIEYNNSIKQ
jgi:hypothetical protein